MENIFTSYKSLSGPLSLGAKRPFSLGERLISKVTHLRHWVAAPSSQKVVWRKATRRKAWPGSWICAAKHVFSPVAAWTGSVLPASDVYRDGRAPGENSRAATRGWRPATEPRLPRLLLGLGQTRPGGSSEGGGGADTIPEDQQQGETHCHRVRAACSAVKRTECNGIIKNNNKKQQHKNSRGKSPF